MVRSIQRALSKLFVNMALVHPLASSIHTIHRPIARSKRQDTPISPRAHRTKAGGYFPTIQSSEEEDGVGTDEEEDFEDTPVDSQVISSGRPGSSTGARPAMETKDRLVHVKRGQMTRTASLATVRIKRRVKLADKLKEVFGLPDINEVIAGMSL